MPPLEHLAVGGIVWCAAWEKLARDCRNRKNGNR